MARKQPPLGVSDSGGARRAVALLAALLLVASALAPVSTTAAIGLGDHAPVVGAAGNADETTVANDESATVGNDDSITIRGQIEASDGDPAANGSVLLGSADRNRTDERGRFRLRGEPNQSYDLTYRQSDERVGDGRPAVYAVGQVNASTDRTRNVSLPAASALNVTVVAENRTAVSNATVRLTHTRGGANATIVGQTDAQGRLTVGGRLGVELAGNVTVAVESPNASFENRTVKVSANDTTEREVTLDLTDDEEPILRYQVAPKVVNVSETVTFDANVTDESGVEEIKWTVQSRPWYTERLNQSFPEPGEYPVRLSATDWAGNENNSTETVTVVDERAPDPALSVSATSNETTGETNTTTGETNETTSKTNTTTVEANVTTVETNTTVRFDASNSSDDHRIAEYRWDLDGDGANERTTNRSVAAVTREYAENGTYDATVTVVDESGNQASANRTITVELPPPTAAFSVSNQQPGIDESVWFNASATTAPAGITQYNWTFEGGQQVTDQQSFRTNFTDSGTYNVTLTVTDERDRVDHHTKTIVVPNDPPKAEAGGDRMVVSGQNVTLDARHTDDLHDDFSVAWNETTNSSATLSNDSAMRPTVATQSVNHTRTLRFELTATDDHGATDTDSVRVVVVPSAKPTITQSPANPTVGEEVTFRANRSGKYYWDFDGDGAFEATPGDENTTDVNVTHKFDAAGEYDVTLADAAGREVHRNVTVAPVNDSVDAPVNDSTSDGSGADNENATDSGNATDDGNVTDSDSDGGDVGGQSGGSAATGGQSGGSAATGGQSDGSAGSGTGISAGGGSNAADSDDSGPSNNSGPGDNSGESEDSSGGDAEVPPSASVTVERVGKSTDRVDVTVEDATAGDRATVELPAGIGENHSVFDAVSVVPARASNFSLSVGSVSGLPEDVTGLDGSEVLSYLEVEERNLTDADVASARFRFRVAVDALDEADIAPEEIRLYRYHGDEWQTLGTSIIERVDGFYRFKSVSPGFSVFAVGTEAAVSGDSSVTANQSDDGDSSDDGNSSDADSSGDGDSSGKDSESDGESGAGTAESADSDSGSSDAGSVSNSTLIVGLFVASLLGAALWGYLLS